MKRVIFVLIIAITLVFGSYFLYFIIGNNAKNITAFKVTDLASSKTQNYHLSTSESLMLISDISAMTQEAAYISIDPQFKLTVEKKWGKTSNYYVLFDKGNIYLRDSGSNKLYSLKSSSFFSSHWAFDKIYSNTKPPEVKFFLSDGDLMLRSAEKSWNYRKLDGNWYTHVFEDFQQNEPNNLDTYEIQIYYSSDLPPQSAVLQIADDAGNIISENVLSDTSIPVYMAEGSFLYRLKLSWLNEAWDSYKGEYVFEYSLDIELPAYFEFSGLDVVQGDIVEIFVHNVKEGEVPVLNQSLFNRFSFFRTGPSSYVGYLPTGYFTESGEYTLEYGISGSELNKETLSVLPRDFHIQYLVVDQAVESSTRNDAAYTEYARYFTPARLTSNEEKYYSEPFVIPAKGRLSTEFGETRHVNGAPTTYRHSGLDIAAPTGAPVYAVNRGKVVLSMNLMLTGNTIVIDHGQGLFSVYFHMHELHLNEGMIAEREQQIGTVGSTGFSTGPHLHLTMSYYDVNLEPGYFLAGEPITYSNHSNYLTFY